MLFLFCVWFLGLFVFHRLERLRPVHAHYRTGYPRRGYVADILWSAVNGPGLSALEKVALTYLVTRVPTAREVFGGWPWAGQFALFLLVSDFGRYWFHRWYHEIGLLWRIHRVHHTVVEMDALSVFRHHVLEAVVKNGLLSLPLRLLGVESSVIIAYSAIDVLKGFWHHANFRVSIGPLNYVLNSPELHWWHHAREIRGQMSNYGSILSIWDWLFGTAYWPRGQWPAEIGVEGLDGFPDDFVGQLTSIRLSDERARAAWGDLSAGGSAATVLTASAPSLDRSADQEAATRAPISAS
jgi:sterol desaturase/sphingolipid hydroxylase (fatty acid hydroxylase superfamily)